MKDKSGFTLIEMLVVVLIIGILAGIALPQYRQAVLKSKYSTLKIAARSIYESENRYYLVHNNYTDDLESLNIEIEDSETVLCSVEVSDKDVGCYLIQNGKSVFAYIIKIGGDFGTGGHHKRCFAFSTNKNDVLNRICKAETGHEPYNNCRSYCAYKYEE